MPLYGPGIVDWFIADFVVSAALSQRELGRGF
jgi:hypothetical protein